MADTYYPIPENPAYNSQIRALQNDDPANAEETFNPLFERLIENTEAVKLSVDNTIPNSQKAEANGIASLDENGKVPLEQIPEGVGMLPRVDVRVISETTVTVTNGSVELIKTGNDVVSFDIPSFGTWTVTAGDYNKTVKIDTVKVYKICTSPLKITSWELIEEISESGTAPKIWSIGDEKDITVGDETLTVVILDFNHDDKSDGSGKAGITFGLKELMATKRKIGAPDSCENDIVNSEVYEWLQGDLLGNLPTKLQSVIKFVDKKTFPEDITLPVNIDSVKVFLFAETEIFDDRINSSDIEGVQYPYFATAANRKKRIDNGMMNLDTWWTRSSASFGGGSRFCTVDTEGKANYSYMSNTKGICFGFCV